MNTCHFLTGRGDPPGGVIALTSKLRLAVHIACRKPRSRYTTLTAQRGSAGR